MTGKLNPFIVKVIFNRSVFRPNYGPIYIISYLYNKNKVIELRPKKWIPPTLFLQLASILITS